MIASLQPWNRLHIIGLKITKKNSTQQGINKTYTHTIKNKVGQMEKHMPQEEK